MATATFRDILDITSMYFKLVPCHTLQARVSFNDLEEETSPDYTKAYGSRLISREAMKSKNRKAIIAQNDLRKLTCCLFITWWGQASMIHVSFNCRFLVLERLLWIFTWCSLVISRQLILLYFEAYFKYIKWNKRNKQIVLNDSLDAEADKNV